METQSDSASSSAAELFLRRVEAASEVQVGARQTSASRLRGEPVLVTERPRGDFFGWFGSFMAFTGANFLRMLHVAFGALIMGTGTVAISRRRRRLRFV